MHDRREICRKTMVIMFIEKVTEKRMSMIIYASIKNLRKNILLKESRILAGLKSQKKVVTNKM